MPRRREEDVLRIRRWARQGQRLVLKVGRNQNHTVHFRLKTRGAAVTDGKERFWVKSFDPEELPKELREEAERDLELDLLPYLGTATDRLVCLIGQRRLAEAP